jgi:hypothetical protein
MKRFVRPLLVAALAALPHISRAQDAGPPGAADPVLRLEGGGPLSTVTAAAFSPDGATLYETGWDKVVRVWKRDPKTGRFAVEPASALRIPIGPGDAGVMNALAVSADGRWLAVGGNAAMPDGAGFRQAGVVVPRSGFADPWAQGDIYVFDLAQNHGNCHQIRAHPGSVQALAFVTAGNGGRPVLVSAGAESAPEGGRARLELVFRVWDVLARAELGRTTAGEFPNLPPSLAAWSTGPGANQVRVAAAWGAAPAPGAARAADAFLVWDLGAEPVRLPEPTLGGRCTVLSDRADRNELLTAHFGQPQAGQPPEGLLIAWDRSAPRAPLRKATLSWSGEPVSPPDVKGVPVAQALVSSGPGRGRDLLAVVLRAWRNPQAAAPPGPLGYRLFLVDLAPDAFGKVRARADLWDGPAARLSVAPSADGSRLAVAGSPRGELLVCDLPALLANRPTPWQTLRGDGEPVRAAAFVRNDRTRDWGLAITLEGRAPGPETPQLVFDLANQRLGDPRGWSAQALDPGGWQTRPVAPKAGAPAESWEASQSLWTYKDGNAVAAIALPPDNPSNAPEYVQVTAHALRRPMGGLADPLVAVAVAEPGVGPRLRLFNGRTGAPCRQLTGHSAVIRSLAFSDDGRLLVSAADDRTVCVWSLTDIDRTVGEVGGLRGVVLKSQNGRYLVAGRQRDPSDPPLGDLQVGDVIEGIVADGKLQVPHSVAEFHYAAGAHRPGQAIILRRRRGGGAPSDVAQTLGQAIDERKPLFSVFLTEPADGQPRGWLAWNPLGPYDRSGPELESLFGWHFNRMDRPDEPAGFALAKEHARFRREGLIPLLIREGRLPPPPEPEPLAPPAMDVYLVPAGTRVQGDLTVLREPPTSLGLPFEDGLPLDRVAAVRWQLDDQPPRAMEQGETSWSADLAKVDWDRAPHKVTVVVETTAPAQTFRRTVRVCYVPPAPAVRVLTPGGIGPAQRSGLEVDDPNFRFAAEVTPAKGVRSQARLTWRHRGEVALDRAFGPDFAAQPVDAPLRLKPGPNTIELVVSNDNLPKGLEGLGTARVGPLTVHYRPKPVDPPVIRTDELVLLPDEPGARPRTVAVETADLGVVEAPRVRLDGKISAKAKLQSAEWRHANGEWKRLAGFTPGGLETAFSETVDLVPGPQEIWLRAATANVEGEQVVATATLTIEHHPAVAKVLDLAANPGDPVVQFGAEAEPTPVHLSARLAGRPGRPEEKASLLLNGDPLPDKVVIDRDAGTLSARVVLPRGANRLQVRLENAWNTTVTAPLAVRYVRPPLVNSFEARPVPGKPFARVAAEVASVTAPTADVEVGHGSAGAPAFRSAGQVRELGPGRWAVAADVQLEEGENEIVLHARNEDGPAAARAERVRYEKPVEPKPQVVFATATAATPDRPDFNIRFRAVSRSAIVRLELVRVRGNARTPLVRFDPARAVRRPDGQFELPADTLVALEPYENAFEVIAANAGGETRAALALNYTPPPVFAEVFEVESGARRMVPEGRADGPSVLREPVPDGRAIVRGRIVWTVADKRTRAADPRASVWVNGFPQVTVALGPARELGRASARSFEAEVLLSRDDNDITVKLQDVPLDIRGVPWLRARCKNPERSFRLHLWVIGIGVEDKDALVARAISAVNGSGLDRTKRVFRTPAFPVARVYGPTCDNLDPTIIYGALGEIRDHLPLDLLPSNDVVMIYYEGGELVERGRTCLLRIRPGKGTTDDDLFPMERIMGQLRGTRGAKLFLCDVVHDPSGAAPVLAESGRLVRDTPFGLLRFSHPGETTPTGVKLAGLIGAAVKQKDVLGDVSAEVSQRTEALRGQIPGLYYSDAIPPQLLALIVGGRP